MQHHEAECQAEKLVDSVQRQGHSEGLYNQNMTILIISSKFLVRLQPNLVFFLVQHHKLERPVEKWDYCIQSQGYKEGSECQ